MTNQETTAPDAPAPDVTARVSAAKTQLIAKAQLVGTLANLAVAALVAGLYWPVTPQAQMITWLACVVGSNLMVMAGAEQFKLNLPLWYRFLNGRLLALSWGLSAVFVFPQGDFATQILLLMLVAGVAAGHLMVTAVWFQAAAWILPLALGPYVVRFLVDSGPFALEVALTLMVFCIILGVVAFNVSKALTGNLSLTFRNEDLMASLAQASDRQEKLLAETEAAYESAERSNRAKTRFLAAASHDLRQPMQALTFLVSALEKQAPVWAHRTTIDDTRRTLESVNSLLTSLLDISRFDAGVVAVERKPFPIEDVLDAVGREFGAVALDKDLQLRVRPSDLWVDSDPALLTRIVRNFVNNALKYTSHGGVLVGCRTVGNTVRVQVWDTGPGIAPHHHEDIFHEFFQLRRPDEDFQSGLGLGLAIVKRIADLLKHAISFRSHEGKGSCFSIDVPRAERQAVGRRQESVDHGSSTAESSFKGLVLAIDDDTAVLSSLATMLRGWGFDVANAQTPEEAVTLVADGAQPALIVTDYRLGDGVNGTDVIDKICAAARCPIPSVIITGDTGPERLRELTQLGHTVLHKPVSADVLLDAVRSTLQSADDGPPRESFAPPVPAASGS